MTPCLTDNELRRLAGATGNDSLLSSADAHLSLCARCQARLESLSAVAEVAAAWQSANGQHESALLRRAMISLQAEAPTHHGKDSTFNSLCGPAKALPNLPPPTSPEFIGRLGDIDVRRVIGRGGMGIVYEGVDSVLQRTVAVKVLSPHLLGDDDGKNRLLREAQAAAALTHESIVTIHAIAETEGWPYLVLQFVNGESLADRLARDKSMPVDEIIPLAIHVARGLAAAHERGLIHRDIKPANILLESGNGVARITDFGLAKKVGLASVTQDGLLAGTPAFMSPEQTADEPLDARSDLFSLGVVLYFASSGHLPFPADSPFVVLHQIRTMAPRQLRDLNPELPDWYCALVHRLLAKRPEHRISTAHEVVQLLERQCTPSKRPTTNWKTVRNYSALALLLIAATYLCFVLNSAVRRPAQSSFSGFQVVGAPVANFANLADAVAAAPNDGKILVGGDGPFSTSTIRIDGKRLTIAACHGSHPRFVPAVLGKNSPAQFIVTTADLHLEGLDINWPIPTPVFRLGEEFLARCVIGLSDGRLVMKQCRVVCGENAVGIGNLGGDMDVRNSHLLAPSASCLVWRPGATATAIHVEQCVLEGQSGIVLVPYANSPPLKATITQNTIVTKWAWRLMMDSRLPQPIATRVSRNVFDCPTIVAMTAGRNLIPTASNSLSMTDELKALLNWTDDANVYRAGTVYLTGSKVPQIMMFTASRLKQLDQWRTFWNASAGPSLEATIRFQVRANETAHLRVAAFEAPTGPIPQPVGANADSVGP